MSTDDKSPEIVGTIVQLAHSLGMAVTAEGVETADQLNQLHALACEYGQGYFFSEPVAGETATKMLVAA
jgi:EAL domain-containing protein (putative c-di-GMP-specific phosphodiesterase class I)